MPDTVQYNVLWEPHPKQIAALERSEFEVLYGGSRGGGKTDAGIAWLLPQTSNSRFRGLVLRRNSDDLRDWVDRASQLYSQLTNSAEKVGNPPEFRFKSGAIIRTGHLNDPDAYSKYQGHEYHQILIEELTQIPEEKSYLRILSSCRSTVPGLTTQVFATTNPGGQGHQWVKSRFIDPAPPGTTIWDGVRARIFIQATMDDNPTLMENDPGYIQNIEALKDVDPDTYHAWRFGDWERFSGQVFKEFKRRSHVISPVVPSKNCTHVLWMDWGYSESSAFACYLTAIVPMQTADGQKYTQLITYREWYGNQKTPKEWAKIIYEDCLKIDRVPLYGVSDPATHAPLQSGDQSISSMFEDEWKALNKGNHWATFKRGSNSGTNSRIGRVGMMHEWLSINPSSKLPYWLVTENCSNLIRTVPMLVHDDAQPEAYDTHGEDHSADSCSYGLEKIRFTAVKPGTTTYGQIEKAKVVFNKEGQELAIDPKAFSAMYAK